MLEQSVGGNGLLPFYETLSNLSGKLELILPILYFVIAIVTSPVIVICKKMVIGILSVSQLVEVF